MKILFYVRSDFYTFGGGDRVQVLKTKEALESMGHQVTVATALEKNIKQYQVVHLFNMQIEPHSLLAYTIDAQRKGVPVALSTIYWNPTEWKKYGEIETPQDVAAVAKSQPFKGVPKLKLAWLMATNSIFVRWLLTYITKPGSGEASSLIKRALISRVDVILPNGAAEGDLVQEDFGPAKLSKVVLNGVEIDFSKPNAKAFMNKYSLDKFVLSVGRIESRKNTVLLAEACRRLDYPLVLVGNDKAEPDYVARVREAYPEVTIIPEMPHEDLGSAYAAAEVYALVSWFETPGLSSMEAGLMGCKVVSTDRGTTKEHFGKNVWYCSPRSESSIEKALADAWKAPSSDALKDHLKKLTWHDIAEKTQEAYEAII